MNRAKYPLSLTLVTALLALVAFEDLVSTLFYLTHGKLYFEAGVVCFLIVPGLRQLRPVARWWAMGVLLIYALSIIVAALIAHQQDSPTIRVFGATLAVSHFTVTCVAAARVAIMLWMIFTLMRSDVRRWFDKPEGVCRACGYTLHATGDACSECGYSNEIFSYPVTIQDESNLFTVAIPDLPGVSASGSTADDAVSAARSAAIKHVRGLLKRGEEIPPPRAMIAHMANQDHAGILWASVEVDLATLRSHL